MAQSQKFHKSEISLDTGAVAQFASPLYTPLGTVQNHRQKVFTRGAWFLQGGFRFVRGA